MKRFPRWLLALPPLAALFAGGFFALSSYPKTTREPVPLAAIAAPGPDCVTEIRGELENTRGEPFQVLELHCASERLALHIGDAWFDLPFTGTPGARPLRSPDQKHWLLEAGMQLYRSDDGGHTFLHLRPPGSEDGASFVAIEVDLANGFQELTVDTDQQAPRAVRERLAYARLALGYDPGAPLTKRLRLAYDALSAPPPNGSIALKSHDGGHTWTRVVVDNGNHPASGTTDLNTPF